MRYLFCVVSIVFALSSAAAVAPAIDFAGVINFKVDKYQLANGMTVLLHVDHSVPLLSIHQWYKVGSKYERPGRTGLAHFFEHLMFKGTERISAKEYESRVQGNGGSNNAFTTRDYTAYYENMPSGTLKLTLELEADRMKNLTFDAAVIQKERDVVKEERRYRVDNSVKGMMFEALFKTAYKVHPYRWPVIGYMKDLNAASIDDLKAFYRTYYAPNNSVLVVAGDFKISQAKEWITKYYGSIAASHIPQHKNMPLANQSGQRKTQLKKDIQNPNFTIAYHGPGAGEDDTYALDLLASILGEGRSSRLYKKLVYQRQASTSVSVGFWGMKESGLFLILSQVAAKGDSNRVIRMFDRVLARLIKKGVTKKELEKAKNKIAKASMHSLKTVAGKAQLLALNEIYFGDYKQGFLDLARYNKVTSEDIVRVASKYLQPKYRSLILINPKQKKNKLVGKKVQEGKKG